MLPAYDSDLINPIEPERYPTLTYRLDWVNKRISGMIDDREAMEQAVRLILRTNRYQWEIYSWGYGSELEGSIGKPLPIIQAEITDKLSEALLADDRVLAVKDVSIRRNGKNDLLIDFTAETIFGGVKINGE